MGPFSVTSGEIKIGDVSYRQPTILLDSGTPTVTVLKTAYPYFLTHTNHYYTKTFTKRIFQQKKICDFVAGFTCVKMK